MDLRPSFESSQAAFGCVATVTTVDGAVETTVVWLPPVTVDHPTGAGDYRRAEAKHVMAVPTDDVPELPRGTVITCPEQDGADPVDWVVDETQQIDADHHRVLLTRRES